jgi:hypothetical protein
MKKLIFATLIAAFSSPALAIDFRAAVADDDGKPICFEEKKDGGCAKELTVGLAVRKALDAPSNQQGVSPAEKDRRGELTQSLIGASEPKLLDADVKMIKDAVGNAYVPSLVHKLWQMLDAPKPTDTPPAAPRLSHSPG